MFTTYIRSQDHITHFELQKHDLSTYDDNIIDHFPSGIIITRKNLLYGLGKEKVNIIDSDIIDYSYT